MEERDQLPHVDEQGNETPVFNTTSCISISNQNYHHDVPSDKDDDLEEMDNVVSERSDPPAPAGSDSAATVRQKQGSKYHVKTPECSHKKDQKNKMVMVAVNFSFLFSCNGIIRVLQSILTLVTLVCLVISGSNDGGLLLLPLSWHFRIMIFVLVITLLFSLFSIVANITSLIYVFPFEWNFIDLLLYSVFAFLYLVATSLVASAFDFYENMRPDISQKTIHQLVVCVVFGYICMALYAVTAVCSYRTWKVEYQLYQRRRLLEEDEIDI